MSDTPNDDVNRVATSDCPACSFTAVEEDPLENPTGAADTLAEHINELHEIEEIPEWYYDE